ncbi:uncharacterized protein [Bemisia tabaci]|uniref:uncharacterized protein n=1 Tax=Bemisia tabaci TaxID=7038 RepID=UPI003B281C36
MSGHQIQRTPTGNWTVVDTLEQPPCDIREGSFHHVQNAEVGPSGNSPMTSSTSSQSAQPGTPRYHHVRNNAGSGLLARVSSRIEDAEPTVAATGGDLENSHIAGPSGSQADGCVGPNGTKRKEKKSKKKCSKTTGKQKVDWKKVRRRLKKTIYSLSEADLILLYRLYQVKYENSVPQIPTISHDNLVELFWREANGTILSVCKLFNLLHVMKKINREKRQKVRVKTLPTKRPAASKRTKQDVKDESNGSSTSTKSRTESHQPSSDEESDPDKANAKNHCIIL